MSPEFFTRHNLPAPVLEYRFHPARKWRFDAAWPAQKLALEVEGGVWSGGRHTSPKGFFGDLEKYNEAAIRGWRVLRVTPKAADTLAAIGLVRAAMQTTENL